ncbi:hypothetical protein Pan189_39820 [Stratiformator vulcanicus]|uniref:Uncharacterized protein n=1 Tax=Stratiformator vulcanicus TaxID=2527980 RepID=A0A517R6V9_9PLAN|nr:hypothetical protein Pan189_39820 [Stratiformator vulcanicus]
MTQKPKPESPIEEIHRVRRDISERFGGDVAAIAADAASRAAESGRPMWQPKSATHSTQPVGVSGVSGDRE